MSNSSFCAKCGAELPSEGLFCGVCGTPLSGMKEQTIESTTLGAVVRRKKPWLAAALSFLIPGLGQWYLRKWKRGAAWFLGSILPFSISLLLFAPIGMIFWALVFRIASAWDAKKKTNQS